MNQNFCVSVDSLVELLVRDLGLLDVDLMRHDERWLGLAGDDQVTEVSVVLLHVALTCSERQTLVCMLAAFLERTRIGLAYLFEQLSEAE